MRIGSRLQVFSGRADQTSGGLRRSDLVKSVRSGKIVSRKKQTQSHQRNNLGRFLIRKRGTRVRKKPKR